MRFGMNAHTSALSPLAGASQISAQAGANTAVMRWNALGQAGGLVGALSGETGSDPTATLAIADALEAAPQWRRELAEAAIADLAAMMEPGLATLLEIDARGGDPRTAAGCLWREYLSAREAVRDLLDPQG